ncbi:LysE family translocator [Streptacidiphilus pinicola]|uniref:LysE family translocator n=1 Tax=Streptacidiphilus pinicola TaxID=2219663 RepID=A0A2X0K530_9ACTN|nr:LysE family translocator [Streptacidiphilus pinicola]RAG82669.1 LysE family translocator [Streptacidiphilus pinicola]
MAMGSVGAFWAVSFLLVLVPGADWAHAIAAGLRDRTVLPAVGGLLLGYVALTAVVAAGLAALVAGSPLVLTVLTAVGAGYLVRLGVATLTRPSTPQAAGAEDDPAAVSWLRRTAKGAGISGLNPKALLLFVALLPQFATRGAAWPFAAQIALLGLVHTANCAAVYAGVGTAARRVLRARPAVARAVTRCSGAAMVVIGVLLLAERLVR